MHTVRVKIGYTLNKHEICVISTYLQIYVFYYSKNRGNWWNGIRRVSIDTKISKISNSADSQFGPRMARMCNSFRINVVPSRRALTFDSRCTYAYRIICHISGHKGAHKQRQVARFACTSAICRFERWNARRASEIFNVCRLESMVRRDSA